MKQISVTKEVQKLEKWDSHQTIHIYIADDITLTIEWPEGHEFDDSDLTICRGYNCTPVVSKQ